MCKQRDSLNNDKTVFLGAVTWSSIQGRIMTVISRWQVFHEERDNARMQGAMAGSRASDDMDGQRREMDNGWFSCLG